MTKFLPLISFLAAFGLGSSALAQDDAEKPVIPKANQDTLAKLAERLLGKNGGDRLFYYPTKTAPDTPKKYGLDFEEVEFESEDETGLHGWFLKPDKESFANPKGTVVFHHGNAGSIGYHIGFVSWKVQAGYQVLLYDYRGYGKSGGEVGRRGMINDVRAAIKYAQAREDVDSEKIISFGHSLGGAQSLTALGEKPIPGVQGIISFAGFASYQDMARRVGGDSATKLVTDDLSARDFVAKISPTPLLLLHGTKDRTVPISQGNILFKKAKEPKTFHQIEDGSHTRALYQNDGEYRTKVLRWIDQTLNKTTPPNEK